MSRVPSRPMAAAADAARPASAMDDPERSADTRADVAGTSASSIVFWPTSRAPTAPDRGHPILERARKVGRIRGLVAEGIGRRDEERPVEGAAGTADDRDEPPAGTTQQISRACVGIGLIEHRPDGLHAAP